MNKRYFLISLVLIVLLSAVVLLYHASLSSEEGAVVLIHTAGEGEVRIAEGDDRFGPLYEECLAVLHSLTPPVEMYVSWEDLSNHMGEEEGTYVVLTLPEPTELVHSYHVSEKTKSETITLQSAIFGLHDFGPYADGDLFVITGAPDTFREDGSPQVVAYNSERGLEHLSALVNGSLPGGGRKGGN